MRTYTSSEIPSVLNHKHAGRDQSVFDVPLQTQQRPDSTSHSHLGITDTGKQNPQHHNIHTIPLFLSFYFVLCLTWFYIAVNCIFIPYCNILTACLCIQHFCCNYQKLLMTLTFIQFSLIHVCHSVIKLIYYQINAGTTRYAFCRIICISPRFN